MCVRAAQKNDLLSTAQSDVSNKLGTAL